METTSVSHGHEEDEEQDVLLDLEGVSGQVHIPPNAPYVLSGLDTLNPILTIDNKLKLVYPRLMREQGREFLKEELTVFHVQPDGSWPIGEYEETIDTCLVFSESDAAPVFHEETGPSEANLFSGKCFVDPKQTSAKQVNPVTSLHKILKFRLMSEAEIEDAATKQSNSL